MAKAATKEKWLIFVDTNIFLDFYRIGGESADRQLKSLEKHTDIIITGDQVRMEFLKNRQKVIVDGINQLGKPKKINFPPIIGDYQAAGMVKKYIKNADENLSKVRNKIERILKNPSQNDPVYQSVQRIFNHNSPYNLTRPDKQRFTVRNLARKRFTLGYPPRKKTDTSIGDAINWEWIIRCAQTSNDNHHILIVSRDGDFGISYGSETILNDWLNREFKDRVSRKRKIALTNKLTVALKILDENVSREDELEEERVLKENSQQSTKSLDYNISSDQELQTLYNEFMELFEINKDDDVDSNDEE